MHILHDNKISDDKDDKCVNIKIFINHKSTVCMRKEASTIAYSLIKHSNQTTKFPVLNTKHFFFFFFFLIIHLTPFSESSCTIKTNRKTNVFTNVSHSAMVVVSCPSKLTFTHFPTLTNLDFLAPNKDLWHTINPSLGFEKSGNMQVELEIHVWHTDASVVIDFLLFLQL